MELNISSVIIEKRKEKGVTQQELADFIGVSKASVSKWETRQNYPDITTLPLLAAYFDISIDKLLNYDIQLSTKEIQNIYISLQKSFETKSSEEILDTIKSLVKQYYSCYPFVFQMGMFIVNHFDLLPGKDREDKLNRYMRDARKLFVHVRNNSNDPKLVEKTSVFEAYVSLALQDTKKVFEVLGKTTPVYYSVESLIAMAFQQEGNKNAAQEIMQSAILQNGSISLNLFTNYLPLTFDDPKRFKESYQKGLTVIDNYELEETSPLVTLNFKVIGIYGFLQIGDEDMLLDSLENYLELIKNIDVEISLQSNAYFNKVDKWIEDLDLGNQLPRAPLQTKDDFITLICDNPDLSSYRDDERFKSIFEQFDLIREKELKKRGEE